MEGRKTLLFSKTKSSKLLDEMGNGGPSETNENRLIPKHITVIFQNTTKGKTKNKQQKKTHLKKQDSKCF